MKKQLLTVGDSFTYGDELSDRYQAWPYKLADSIGYEVHNMGQSGCGNGSILRRTLEELAHTNYDLVVIGWSSPGRIEWKDDIGVAYDIWPGYPVTAQFFKDHPWRADLLNYISQYHNSQYLYQQYLIKVISLQSYFQTRKINYLMMDTRYNDYYRKVGRQQHSLLEQQIDNSCFVGFQQFGMVELTIDCPRGKGGHPLEQGHTKIANEFKKHIRN